MSDSDSSDDDVANLIARTKQNYPGKRKLGNDYNSAAAAPAALGDYEEDDDDDDDSRMPTAISSRLDEMEYRQRVRARASLTRRPVDSDDDDDDDDDDEPLTITMVDADAIKPVAAAAAAPPSPPPQDSILELSSDDDDDGQQQRARNLRVSHQSKELLAIQAARLQLLGAQQYTAKTIDSPVRHTSAPKVEMWLLTVHCKMIEQSSVESTRVVSISIRNNATLTDLQQQLFQACQVDAQATILSGLTLDGQALWKTGHTHKPLTSLTPKLQSKCVLKATLRLTGLTSLQAKGEDGTLSSVASNNNAQDEATYGALIKICLRRMLDKKEQREEWSIRQREPFSRLITRYYEKHKVSIKLRFDGQTIKLDATPKDFEMEEEDLIDVIV
jgi:hypothetical protein